MGGSLRTFVQVLRRPKIRSPESEGKAIKTCGAGRVVCLSVVANRQYVVERSIRVVGSLQWCWHNLEK